MKLTLNTITRLTAMDSHLCPLAHCCWDILTLKLEDKRQQLILNAALNSAHKGEYKATLGALNALHKAICDSV